MLNLHSSLVDGFDEFEGSVMTKSSELTAFDTSVTRFCCHEVRKTIESLPLRVHSTMSVGNCVNFVFFCKRNLFCMKSGQGAILTNNVMTKKKSLHAQRNSNV